MKAANFFKSLEQADDEERKEEKARIDNIIKDELAKRMTTEQLDQMEFDEKMKENYETSSGSRCIICLENEPKMAFVPCGHKNICKGCRTVFKSTKCPLCRTDITGIMEIFEN